MTTSHPHRRSITWLSPGDAPYRMRGTRAFSLTTFAALAIAAALLSTFAMTSAAKPLVVSVYPCPTVTPKPGTTPRVEMLLGVANPSRPALRISPPQCSLNIRAGTSTITAVTVRNDATTAQTVWIDALELAPTTTGDSFAAPATSRASRARARQQVQLPVSKLVIKAGMAAQIPVRVVMPADAAAGLHPFVVTAATRMSKPGSSTDGTAVVSINAAVGSELLVTVPGRTDERVTVGGLSGPRLLWHGATGTFRFTVTNRGHTLAAAPAVWSAHVGDSSDVRSRVLMLPGGSRTYEPRWKASPWIGRVHPTVTYAPPGATADTRVTATYPAVWVLPPWWLIALAIVAIIAPLWRRRTRRRCAEQNGIVEEDVAPIT